MKSLTDSLRDSIGGQHARMEKLPFVAALTGGTLPLNCYAAQLRAMAVIHSTLEHELRQIQPTPVTVLYQSRPSRLAHLRTDLAVFDRLFIPDCMEAVKHALHIAGRIRMVRLEQPEDLNGFMYVLEGTTLGNAVHYRDVLKNFGDHVAGTAHYYAGYGDMTGEYWKEFRFAMNALPMDRNRHAQIIGAAHGFFDLLEPLYSALYPVGEKGWGFSATMLNPEAGNHPVPDSEAEIKAATTAARRCREEFPYFDERYQERGRSFAKSDAAWLVTLTALPQSRLMSQVEWLGRVLGNRGMPRITLERQLELLHEELVAAVPEKQKIYDGLLEAASCLKSDRMSYIPETAFKELAAQFHTATHKGKQEKFRGTGELIVSAVCDEAAGIPEAVRSLLSWLTDPHRFSPEWTSEVTKTAEMAHNEVLCRTIRKSP